MQTPVTYNPGDVAPLRFTIGYDSRFGSIQGKNFALYLEEWKRLGYKEVCITANNVIADFTTYNDVVGIAALEYDYPAYNDAAVKSGSYNDFNWRGTMTGTVAYTIGGTTVTGTGTLFTTQAQVGMILRRSDNDQVIGTVASIASATSLTVASPITIATATGVAVENKPVYNKSYNLGNSFYIYASGATIGNYNLILNPDGSRRDGVVVRIDDMLNYPFSVGAISLTQYYTTYPLVNTVPADVIALTQCIGSFTVTPLLPFSAMAK